VVRSFIRWLLALRIGSAAEPMIRRKEARRIMKEAGTDSRTIPRVAACSDAISRDLSLPRTAQQVA
jgi:hypothetical protein